MSGATELGPETGRAPSFAVGRDEPGRYGAKLDKSAFRPELELAARPPGRCRSGGASRKAGFRSIPNSCRNYGRREATRPYPATRSGPAGEIATGEVAAVGLAPFPPPGPPGIGATAFGSVAATGPAAGTDAGIAAPCRCSIAGECRRPARSPAKARRRSSPEAEARSARIAEGSQSELATRCRRSDQTRSFSKPPRPVSRCARPDRLWESRRRKEASVAEDPGRRALGTRPRHRPPGGRRPWFPSSADFRSDTRGACAKRDGRRSGSSRR